MKKDKIRIAKCGCKYTIWVDFFNIEACSPCEYHCQKRLQKDIKKDIDSKKNILNI